MPMELHNVTGNYHNCPPVLNNTAEILFCACGSTIKQISSKTGEMLSVFGEHSNAVTCIVLDRKHSANGMVYSASLDGVLIYWNAKTRVIRKQWNLNAPIYNLLVPSSKPTELFVVLGKFQQAPVSTTDEKSGASTDIVLHAPQQSATCGANLQSLVGKEQYKVCCFDIVKGRITRKVAKLYLPHRTACLTMLYNEEYLLTVNKRKLFLWNVCSDSFVGYRALSELPHSITCITASTVADTSDPSHSSDSPLEYSSYYGRSSNTKQIVVTGHDNGAILVWHDLAQWVVRQPVVTMTYDSESQKRVKAVTVSTADGAAVKSAPVCTTLHWHAHNVYALSLSADCRQLYSGGEEGVLVVWQLEGSNKHFLPRLGASIADIVSNPVDARIAVTTTDNCIRLVNVSAMKDDWVLRSIHMGSYCNTVSKLTTGGGSKSHCIQQNPYEPLLSERNTYRSQLVVEPRSNYIVGNGIPNLLQFYDVSTGVFRSAHEVMQYSRVSKTEKHAKLFVPTVTMYCFGKYKLSRAVKNGKGKASSTSVVTDIEHYMATVDVLRGEEMTAETSLKLWKFDVNSASYKLSVQIDRPFEGHKVTALCFVPDVAGGFVGLATASSGGAVKLWYQRQGAWKCMYSFTYKDAAVHALCFSADASLLCVTHGNLVSFWDPVSIACKGTLVVPSPNNITYCKFVEPCFEADYGSGSGESYLVLGTRRSLTVVDCLTMAVSWHLETSGCDYIAVAANDSEAMDVDGGSVAGRAGRKPKGWIAVVHGSGSGSDSSSNCSSCIYLYDPSSRVPVYSSAPLTTGVVSMAFYTDNFSSEGRNQAHLRQGVLFVTSAGELRALGEMSVDAAATGTGTGTAVAQIKTQQGPQLVIEDGYMNSVSEDTVQAMERAPGKGGGAPWYTSTVPASATAAVASNSNSGGMSVVSSIYESFMSGLLAQAHADNSNTNDYNAGADVNVYSSSSSSSSSSKSGMTLEDMEKSLLNQLSVGSPSGIADNTTPMLFDMDAVVDARAAGASKRPRVATTSATSGSALMTDRDVSVLRQKHAESIELMSGMFASTLPAEKNNSKKRK